MELPIGNFLGQMENYPAISFFGLAQQAAKFVETTGFLTIAAKSDVVGRFPLYEVRLFGRLFALVGELIEWIFECTGQLFQRFDGGNSMTTFYAE